MKNAQQIIKHELLNIFTVMGHIISPETNCPKAKKQLLELITLSSLLVSHSEIFSNKKPKFFYQKVFLNELLETSFYIAQENESGGKKLTIFLEKVFIKIDRYYIGEALREILRRLLQLSQTIQAQFDETTRTLKLIHTGKNIIPKKVDLLDILNSKNRENREIFFQLGLKILQLSKVTLKEKKGELLLIFPENSRI
jgi:hypothetical protein